MNILAAMFCLGVYTLLAQMLVTRELSVLCLGNELTIGIVFSVWLVLVGAGAWSVGNGAASRAGRSRKRLRSEYLFLWLAVALPVVILALRAGAGLIRPVGEYPDFLHVFGAAFLALAPLCVPAGMMFPLGCEMYSREKMHSRGVSGVYAVEALGSFVGGAVFSFFLIERFCVMQIAFMAVVISLAGSLFASDVFRSNVGGAVPCRDRLSWVPGVNSRRTECASHIAQRLFLIISPLLLVALGLPSWLLMGLEQRSAAWRWASLGVVREAKEGLPAVTFMGGTDSRYQNLALVESQGLFTLYGDGQVMFSFPDEVTCERAVNFVMAQKPDARRVLLLGGNPAGELPYLLRYPVREVVHVERDPAIDALVRRGAPGCQGSFEHDPRLTRVYEDGPRFVKRCKTPFDVVLVHSPEPVTGGLNRFYTREFYEDVRAILAPGGFMHTSVEASERLEQDASRMAGSIYQALTSVFPVVKVTAGSPLQFFASGRDGLLDKCGQAGAGGTAPSRIQGYIGQGGPGATPAVCRYGGLTEDREELYRRSASAKVVRTSFQPLYLRDSDEWEPGKVALTQQRLKLANAPVNTIRRPVSCYYSLILWGRYSDSVLGPGLRWLERINPGTLVLGIMGLGGLGILIGVMARRRYPSGVVRITIGKAMAVTGFCGVALELILLYAFQGFYGYVYGRMGFMVGLFMFGTVLGAWQIRGIERSAFPVVRRTVAAGLMMMGVLALAVWVILMNAVPAEWELYGLTLAVGGVVGMQFVAVTRLFVESGVASGGAAAWAWLADYAGSALGGLVVGVFLVAVLGIATTCVVLCAVLGVTLALFIILLSPTRAG